MIPDLLLALTLFSTILLAQAFPLELVVTQTRAGQMHRKSWVSNAIYIGGGLALTAAHCIARVGWRTESIKAGKRGTATVEKSNGKVAVLRIDAEGSHGLLAARLPDFQRTKPIAGEWLIHKYYDHDAAKLKDRVVTWHGKYSKIREVFVMGMSGSGVYREGGQLVGVAELQDGTVWNVQDIRELMEDLE